MKALKRTVIAFSVLCLSLCTQAQITSQLSFRRYTTQDGLPQMQAERVWQDSRGYIYIGTLSGFVRFDGHDFTPFLKGRRLNIVGFQEIGNEVRALGFFRQWTVSYDEASPLPLDSHGHWLLNNFNAGSLPNGYVILEDSLEEHRRLCRMTTHGFTTILSSSVLDEMMPDRKLYVDADVTYVPTEKGLYKVERQPVQATVKITLLTRKHDIYTLHRNGQELLAFASDGIYKVTDQRLKRIATSNWTSASYGLTVRPLRSGSLVMADEHSIYLYDGRSVRQLFTGINLIRDLLVDRWDRLWVATYQGVYCFFNRCFTNHTLTDKNDIVRAIAINDEGKPVTGTLNGKVLTASHVISDNPEQFFAPCAVNIQGNIYMAGNGDIACITGEKMKWLGLPHDRYQFVGQAWGQLITGNRNSIIAVNPQTLTVDTLTTDILHPWCVAPDNKNRLWVGSSSGLFCITQDHQVIKKTYDNQKLIITTMIADDKGTVFFASADSVFMIHDEQIESLNPQLPKLAGHEVRSLHVSPQGYIVVAVLDGLFVGNLSKDYSVSDFRFFNHLNGFTMTEPLKATMAEQADGTIWLPGIEQMMSFRPADLLAYHEEDTYINPPLRWWQHWWVWLIGILLLSVVIWSVTRWYEKRRARRRLIRLQHDKQQREALIAAIRQKAIEEVRASELAKDIVKMTDKPFDERLTLRTASGTLMVDVKDIAYFKADGNYSLIVTFHNQSTVLLGLGALEKMLDPAMFVRADRSTLVNIHYISNLMPRQRRCIFRSPTGQEVETTLLAPAFKRLTELL